MPALAYDKTARTFDSDGRMHVRECNISKANVCPYMGREIPGFRAMRLDPNRVYRMWRHPDELARAADSFRNAPLLSRHIAFEVDAPPKDDVCGTIGSDVTFDGVFLRAAHLTVWDQEAIQEIERGEKEELSSSYGYDADMTPGMHPEYGAYDGIMRNIRGNHVAVVIKGRAGSDVRVSDSQLPRLRKMKPELRARIAAACLALTGQAANDVQILAMDSLMNPAWDGWSDSERKAAMDAWRAQNNVANDAQLNTEQECSAWDWARDNAPQYKPGGTPARGNDALPPPTLPPLRALTQADLDAAARRAEDAATARVSALFAARAAVEPLVGPVLACDSAEGVYRFALKHLQVAGHDTIHATALPALFAEVAKARSAAPPARVTNRAQDAAFRANIGKSLPGLFNVTLAS